MEQNDPKQDQSCGWDPVLLKLIDGVDDQPSVPIEEIGTDQVVEIKTEHMTFTLVVIDAAQGRVSVSCRGIITLEPLICDFHGSSWGGSMIKNDLLVVGMRLEFRIQRQVFRTPEVQCIQIRRNAADADEIVKFAKWRQELASE